MPVAALVGVLLAGVSEAVVVAAPSDVLVGVPVGVLLAGVSEAVVVAAPSDVLVGGVSEAMVQGRPLRSAPWSPRNLCYS